MSPTPAPSHLSGHHRDTIRHILQHPVGHNIDWPSVVSLLEAIAQVEETHTGNLLITLGGETETFEPPRHKDIDTQQVVDLRRMLKRAGYGLDPDGTHITEPAASSPSSALEASQ
jgi:rubrerythrin